MKLLKLLMAVFLFALLISGCRYSFIVPPPEEPGIPPDQEVSFSQNIETIFNDNDNCTKCHYTGNQLPDLTTGNAYNSLNSARYVNKSNPSESLIYTHPNPDSNSSHQKKYTPAQAALVLRWIEEGAQKN